MNLRTAIALASLMVPFTAAYADEEACGREEAAPTTMGKDNLVLRGETLPRIPESRSPTSSRRRRALMGRTPSFRDSVRKAFSRMGCWMDSPTGRTAPASA